jgi:hypothetical protein
MLENLDYLYGYVGEDGVRRVLIRPADRLIEVTEDFVKQLKSALEKKVMMIQAGIEEPDPISTFAMMVLKDAW